MQEITRRQFHRNALNSAGIISLSLTAAPLLSSCSGNNSPSIQERTLNRIIEDKQNMLDRVNHVLSNAALDSQTRQTLNVISGNHRDHLVALAQLSSQQPSSDRSSSPTSVTVQDIAHDSTTAAMQRTEQVLTFTEPTLVRLLCLIGACEAVHAEMLAANE